MTRFGDSLGEFSQKIGRLFGSSSGLLGIFKILLIIGEILEFFWETLNFLRIIKMLGDFLGFSSDSLGVLLEFFQSVRGSKVTLGILLQLFF